jgi:hypothetical protein
MKIEVWNTYKKDWSGDNIRAELVVLEHNDKIWLANKSDYEHAAHYLKKKIKELAQEIMKREPDKATITDGYELSYTIDLD